MFFKWPAHLYKPPSGFQGAGYNPQTCKLAGLMLPALELLKVRRVLCGTTYIVCTGILGTSHIGNYWYEASFDTRYAVVITT